MYDLKDKVVLITGAAKGIGAVISSEVLKEGAKHVRILDVDITAGENLQNELNNKYGAGKAKFVKCDVTNDDQLFGAFNETKDVEGYIDVVVNNAGITNEVDYAAVRQQIQINYIALVNGSFKAVEMMDKSKGGKGGTVINISSVAGLGPILTPCSIYSSTKSAILQFTSCLGADPFFEDTGIRALTMCYGATDTTILDAITPFQRRNEQMVKDIFGKYPKQSVEAAAQGTIEAYKKGKSASIWLVNGDKAAIDITENSQKCNEEYAKILNP